MGYLFPLAKPMLRLWDKIAPEKIKTEKSLFVIAAIAILLHIAGYAYVTYRILA